MSLQTVCFESRAETWTKSRLESAAIFKASFSDISPRFGDSFCLSFGKPIPMDDYLNLSINEFNDLLYEKMIQAEKIALKNVGR